MTSAEFQTQMQRMANTYGKNAYPTERAQLIWREVQSLDARWFQYVCDLLISNNRQAPLVADFGQEASRERERLWRIEKQQNTQTAQAFMSGQLFNDDDQKMFCQQIRRRLTKQLGDDEWGQFIDLMQKTIAANKKAKNEETCKGCDGTGVVLARNKTDGTNCCFRCTCPRGQADKRQYPIWSFTLKREYEVV